MAFVTGPKVLVRQRDEKTWTLEEPVVYQGRDDTFTVPAGTVTDFASVPRVFVWLVPPYGLFTAAAVLHDHLWSVLVPAGAIGPVDADGLFRRAMRELGVPFLVRWFMWAAVRWAALGTPVRRPGWLGELPRVALVTVVALPVVAVPVVAILLGFGLFAVAEQIAFLLLLAGRRLRPGGDKEINRPDPSLWT